MWIDELTRWIMTALTMRPIDKLGIRSQEDLFDLRGRFWRRCG